MGSVWGDRSREETEALAGRECVAQARAGRAFGAERAGDGKRRMGGAGRGEARCALDNGTGRRAAALTLA